MSGIAKKAKKVKVIRGILCFFLLDSTVMNSHYPFTITFHVK